MNVYFTSKNTGPSWQSDPYYLVYIGTSLDEAIEAVGGFVNCEQDTTGRDGCTAIPSGLVREFLKYYAADGWWYSIVKVQF